MRLTKDELIWKALVALDELVERASKGKQIPRSLLLRFNLAFLYSIAEPTSRPDFNQLWRLLTAPPLPEGVERVARNADLTVRYNGICRAIGWERTVTLMQYLAAARRLEKRIAQDE